MNKYQKLAGNTVIFAIGSFGMKFLSFILTRLYTAFMTKAEYGTADLLLQTVNVLYPIVTLSMADAVIRFGMDKGFDKRQVYTSAIFSCVIGLGVLAFVSPLFNLMDIFFKGYGFLLYACCYFSCFRQIASNFVRSQGYVRLFAADGIFSTLVIVICNIIFLVVLDMGVTGYMLSIMISDILSFTGLTALAGLHKCLDVTYFSKSLFKDMLKYSAPLIPTYVMWWITSASDRLFVIPLCGDDANGIYSAAYKIPSLLMMLTSLFYQAWQMSAIENRNDAGLAKFYTKIYGAYSSILMIGAAGIIMLVKPLTWLLVDKDFMSAYLYTPILVIAMIFQCLCQFASSVYSVKKKSINSMITSIIAAVTNIILNFLLIPQFGVYGAAIATAAAYFICFVIRILDVRNYIPFKAYHIRTVINTAAICGMALIAVTEPKLTYLWLVLLFALVTLLNFGAVMSTVKKILDRRKPKTETV